MVPGNEAIEGAEEIEFAAGCEATTILPTIHPERMEQEVALPHEINLSGSELVVGFTSAIAFTGLLLWTLLRLWLFEQ
jgi:hypothetical protein